MSNDDPILRALCKGFVLAEAYCNEADCKLFHEAEQLYRAAAHRSCGFPDCTCPPDSAGDVHCPLGVSRGQGETFPGQTLMDGNEP
jgi:hypothetical protein